MQLLDGVMDIYLTDFKYGNDACAVELSNAPSYWQLITRNHRLAARQGNLIVRHLVMPGHVDCCSLPIMNWLAVQVPDAIVNVMDQYRPFYKASQHPELDRSITREEYCQVVEHARRIGLQLVD